MTGLVGYRRSFRSVLLKDGSAFTVTYWRPDHMPVPNGRTGVVRASGQQQPLRRDSRGRGLCPVTGKVRYGDRLRAERAVASALLTGHAWRRETRVYVCPHCGMWHVTSRARP